MSVEEQSFSIRDYSANKAKIHKKTQEAYERSEKAKMAR